MAFELVVFACDSCLKPHARAASLHYVEFRNPVSDDPRQFRGHSMQYCDSCFQTLKAKVEESKNG